MWPSVRAACRRVAAPVVLGQDARPMRMELRFQPASEPLATSQAPRNRLGTFEDGKALEQTVGDFANETVQLLAQAALQWSTRVAPLPVSARTSNTAVASQTTAALRHSQ